MNCTEKGCDRPVERPTTGLCLYHRRKKRALERLDELEIRPCAGGCGQRVHNIDRLVVPGVVQGRGPNSAWCYGCVKQAPPGKGKETRFGHCNDCKRPMVYSRFSHKGYVRHGAHGKCNTCYNRPFQDKYNSRRRQDTLDRQVSGYSKYNAGHLLNTVDVADIRARLNAGERQVDLSREYRVSRTAIYDIAHRNTWVNVEPAHRAETV